MKYTFETEDTEEAKDLIQASDIKAVLFTFDQWLRGEIKHNGKPYDEVRETLREMLNDYNVTIE